MLKAYAALDPEVGYTQGMNFIVAMLLMFLHDEEDSFWCLVSIMFPKKGLKGIEGKHNWRSIFVEGMGQAHQMDKNLKKKLCKRAPDLLLRILADTDGQNLYPISCSVYSSLFIADQRLEIGRRLFELFLLRGHKFITSFMLKCLLLKHHVIINYDEVVLAYIRKNMIADCIEIKGSLHNLL